MSALSSCRADRDSSASKSKTTAKSTDRFLKIETYSAFTGLKALESPGRIHPGESIFAERVQQFVEAYGLGELEAMASFEELRQALDDFDEGEDDRCAE